MQASGGERLGAIAAMRTQPSGEDRLGESRS
jgi:hypothetical protein